MVTSFAKNGSVTYKESRYIRDESSVLVFWPAQIKIINGKYLLLGNFSNRQEVGEMCVGCFGWRGGGGTGRVGAEVGGEVTHTHTHTTRHTAHTQRIESPAMISFNGSTP